MERNITSRLWPSGVAGGTTSDDSRWRRIGGQIVWAAATCVLGVFIGVHASASPETVLGLALGSFWASILMVKLYRMIHRSLDDPWLRQVAVGGLLIRIPVIFAHLAVGFILFGGRVDFTVYAQTASRFGQQILRGESAFFDLPFSSPPDLGWALLNRILGVSYVFMGPSLVSMFFLSGMIGFLGSYLFLRAFQIHFGDVRETRFLALVIFFFPSLAFWTSLLGKDSWVYMCLGVATYSVVQMLRRLRPRHGVGFCLSVGTVVVFRPEIGAAVLLAAVAAFFVRPMPRSTPVAMLRPVRWILSGFLIAGVAALAVMTPLISHVLEAAVNKHVGLSTDPTAGGSSLPVQITAPVLREVVRFLPGGMFTALFRPMIFEAHNSGAAIAAVDSTLLLLLVLRRARHLVAGVFAVHRNPLVVFCGIVVVLFTAALAFEANFGALVRHRTMVLPFLFILLSLPRWTTTDLAVK